MRTGPNMSHSVQHRNEWNANLGPWETQPKHTITQCIHEDTNTYSHTYNRYTCTITYMCRFLSKSLPQAVWHCGFVAVKTQVTWTIFTHVHSHIHIYLA